MKETVGIFNLYFVSEDDFKRIQRNKFVCVGPKELTK